MERIIAEDMENILKRKIPWEKFKNKTVLVTGAYGMLASYIVFFLMHLNRQGGYHIGVLAQGRSVDRAKERFTEFWEDPLFRYTDQGLLDDFSRMGRADYIIHAAGVSNPSFYASRPTGVIEPNVIGTYQLLEYARKYNTEGFLYFSSGDVYGEIEDNFSISEDMMGRLDPLDPHSCYGESKRMGETMCAAFYREYGLRTVSARIAHTYGPTMDPYRDSRVFASFMQCVLENRNIEILSDGQAKRPFCYLADATAAFFLLLLKGEGGQAYNVCNSKEFLSIRELAELLVSLDKRKKISFIYKEREKKDLYLETRVNKDNRTVEYKLNKLGWECEYTATEGFQRVYDHFCKDN